MAHKTVKTRFWPCHLNKFLNPLKVVPSSLGSGRGQLEGFQDLNLNLKPDSGLGFEVQGQSKACQIRIRPLAASERRWINVKWRTGVPRS